MTDDLKERLQRSTKAFKANDFSDAPQLFDILKEASKLTAETVEAADEWAEALYRSWTFARRLDNERQGLFATFSKNDSITDEEFIENYSKATKKLKDKIVIYKNNLQTQAAQSVSEWTYVPIPLQEHSPVLAGYEDVGQILLSERNVVVREMTELAQKTYGELVSGNLLTAPSFIVCSSSGMGKTQLPFSLDIPVLYFCCGIAGAEQDIYGMFNSISKHFFKLLKADFEAYHQKLRKDPKLIVGIEELIRARLAAELGAAQQNSETTDSSSEDTFENEIEYGIQDLNFPSPKVNVGKIPECESQSFTEKEVLNMINNYSLELFTLEYLTALDHKFRAPAFLVALFQNIALLKKNKPDLYWPRLELMLKEPIYSEPITFTGAKLSFAKIISDFKNFIEPLLLPLVFLDEFNVNSNTLPETKALYSFYRSIIRACGLIPVLMGTNSHITNLVSVGTASGSQLSVWSYVFYKLPEYPQKLFMKNIQNANLNDSQTKMLKSFFPLLKGERPLFIQAIFLKIADCAQNRKPLPETLLEWLRFILDEFQKAFVIRKVSYLASFYAYQIRLFRQAYRKKNLQSGFKKNSYKIPMLIHSYLATLKPPDDINPEFFTYFKLYRLPKGAVYLSTEFSLIPPSYRPQARLPLFSESPLTCMAFSRNEKKIISPFRMHSTCYTAFQAVVECATVPKNLPTNIEDSNIFIGAKLEQIVSMAFMVASHTKLLSGMPFKEWFAYFIQQLACYNGKIQETPKPIKFPSSFHFLNEIVPYFAFDCDQWPREFMELVKNENVQLGTYTGAFRESRDLAAVRFLTTQSQDPSAKRAKQSQSQAKGNRKFSTNPVMLGIRKEPHCVGDEKLFSIECKLQLDDQARAQIRQVIIKIVEKKILSKFNLIVARKISPNIEFRYEPKYFEIQAEKMASKSEKGVVELNPTDSSVIQPVVMEPKSASNSDQVLENNIDSFPYDNISIFRLSSYDVQSQTSVMAGDFDATSKTMQELTASMRASSLVPSCLYHVRNRKLFLEPVYDCQAKTAAVFILIDLSEIHGEKHLNERLSYFRGQ